MKRKNLINLILEALKLKGMNLEKLSQLSGVSERSLALLLEEQFDKLPPAPYVHGYLVKIAETLNLDGRELWREYLKNNEEIRRSGKEDILPLNRFAIPKLNKKLSRFPAQSFWFSHSLFSACQSSSVSRNSKYRI